MRCPVYATPFAANVLRRKLDEVQLRNKVTIHEIAPGGAFELAPFKLRFIKVAHSIPEAQALVIDTSYGTVLHTGDWKLDAKPPRAGAVSLIPENWLPAIKAVMQTYYHSKGKPHTLASAAGVAARAAKPKPRPRQLLIMK
mgnify:CR=1 FL=1